MFKIIKQFRRQASIQAIKNAKKAALDLARAVNLIVGKYEFHKIIH